MKKVVNVDRSQDRNRASGSDQRLAFRAALSDLVGEAARIDHNLRLPEKFWEAYRKADDLLVNATHQPPA